MGMVTAGAVAGWDLNADRHVDFTPQNGRFP